MTAPVARQNELLMKRAAKTFHGAARLLPGNVRGDVVALYAFCRRIDDLADDPSRPLQFRRDRLASIIKALDACDREVLQTVGWTFGTAGRMPQAAVLLVRAALGDLEQQQPRNEQEVLAYAFGVAGTVGIMMAEVLRARPEGLNAAVALGMAMQLSNICRDVREDLQQGRVYLPHDMVTADEVRLAVGTSDGAAADTTKAAMVHLLVLADALYRDAESGMAALPWRIRWSILAAAMCYREIGVAVRNDIPASWTRRTVVGRGRKLLLIAYAGLRLLQPRFWRVEAQRRHYVLSGEALLQTQRLGLAP